jgi:hypothetical protein
MRPRLTILLVFLSASSAFGDGGTLRLSQERGGVRVSVFTSPTPLRPGIIDVSVLVQDGRGNVRLGVPVRVRAWPEGEPGSCVEAEATAELATNKLMRAAHLELDRPGRWHLSVRVEAVEAECDVELGAAPPSWWELAPWVGWPFAVVAMFLLFFSRAPRTTSPQARL